MKILKFFSKNNSQKPPFRPVGSSVSPSVSPSSQELETQQVAFPESSPELKTLLAQARQPLPSNNLQKRTLKTYQRLIKRRQIRHTIFKVAASLLCVMVSLAGMVIWKEYENNNTDQIAGVLNDLTQPDYSFDSLLPLKESKENQPSSLKRSQSPVSTPVSKIKNQPLKPPKYPVSVLRSTQPDTSLLLPKWTLKNAVLIVDGVPTEAVVNQSSEPGNCLELVYKNQIYRCRLDFGKKIDQKKINQATILAGQIEGKVFSFKHDNANFSLISENPWCLQLKGKTQIQVKIYISTQNNVPTNGINAESIGTPIISIVDDTE